MKRWALGLSMFLGMSISSVSLAADFNGDGKDDIGVFRDTDGLWAIRGVTRACFGMPDDDPMPGDYDGDGTADIAIFRDAAALWAVQGITQVYFGMSADQPRPGDYNGDGTTDFAIFRPSTTLWAVKGVTQVYFGNSLTDYLVPGDYSGDGTDDIAIFRDTGDLWAIWNVGNIYFESTGYRPIAGDYDGNCTWEPGIFSWTRNLWAMKGVTRVSFGTFGDTRVPTDYDGDGSWDVGIFRETTGLWAIRGFTRCYFGAPGDTPIGFIPDPAPASPTIRDNILLFTRYVDLNSVTFAFSGDYSITSGQPWGGITGSSSEGSYTIDVRAGRKGSSGPAQWFKDRATVAFCTQIYGIDNWPADLNFAFTGTIVIDGNSYELVIGQGHSDVSGNNNWWYGGIGFYRGADGLTTPDQKYFICPIDSTTINELYIQPN